MSVGRCYQGGSVASRLGVAFRALGTFGGNAQRSGRAWGSRDVHSISPRFNMGSPENGGTLEGDDSRTWKASDFRFHVEKVGEGIDPQ